MSNHRILRIGHFDVALQFLRRTGDRRLARVVLAVEDFARTREHTLSLRIRRQPRCPVRIPLISLQSSDLIPF